MNKLENIVKGAKDIAKGLALVSLLYGAMEAHYQLPYNIKALGERDASTPSAMFRTKEVAERALKYQDKILGE